MVPATQPSATSSFPRCHGPVGQALPTPRGSANLCLHRHMHTHICTHTTFTCACSGKPVHAHTHIYACQLIGGYGDIHAHRCRKGKHSEMLSEQNHKERGSQTASPSSYLYLSTSSLGTPASDDVWLPCPPVHPTPAHPHPVSTLCLSRLAVLGPFDLKTLL